MRLEAGRKLSPALGFNGCGEPLPDAHGGIPAIVMEMLLYSRPGVIEVLPALPATLAKGSINGMLARTFARIDKLAWEWMPGPRS